jgi:hypothetical protein
MSNMRQELLIILEYLGSRPDVGGFRVAHLLVFCVVFFFVIVLCLVRSMLPVSLDCSFLIAPSVFSNAYSLKRFE